MKVRLCKLIWGMKDLFLNQLQVCPWKYIVYFEYIESPSNIAHVNLKVRGP